MQLSECTTLLSSDMTSAMAFKFWMIKNAFTFLSSRLFLGGLKKARNGVAVERGERWKGGGGVALREGEDNFQAVFFPKQLP